MSHELGLPASLRPDPVVLYFHHVGRPFHHYTSISTAEFSLAVDAVEEVGEVVTPGARSAHDGFVLTFDDGYAETLENALSVLEDRRMVCALFVNTATVGRKIPVPGSSETRPAATWRDLAFAVERGHVIGSHGHRHVDWTTLTAHERQEEVRRSAGDIRDNLGLPPFAFAYPYGRRPLDLPMELETHDFYATVRERAAHHSCRPHAIRRVYLPARAPRSWPRLLRGWAEARGSTGLCCDRDEREVVRAGHDG